MSFFNNIEKVVYHNNKDEVVSLSEYIIFEDEKNKHKCILFKFQNNVNQILKKFKFKVSQFDDKGNLIETAILEHTGFEAAANTNFVPHAKMKAHANCVKIKVETLYALFERIEWENNEFRPVEYSVDDFRKDFGYVEPHAPIETKKNKKVKKVKEKSKKKNKKPSKKDRRSIVIKNIMKQNLTVSPKVWAIIFTILLFAFIIATAFMYKGQANQFYDNGFEYTIQSESEVYISDYDNKDMDVVIPEKVEDYTIVGIGENAFKDCTITSVTFSSALPVGRNAFANCKKLSTINKSNYISSVGEYAFKNCESLLEIDLKTVTNIGLGAFEGCSSLTKAILPVAVLESATFNGCLSLTELECSSTRGTLASLFGDVLPQTFTTLKIKKSHFEKGYFENMSSIKELIIDAENPTFEYGSLIGIGLDRYEYNDTMEVLNGEVITYNGFDKLNYPSSVSNIASEIEKLGDNASLVTELTIASNAQTISYEAMSKMPNINTLIYAPGVYFEANAFNDNYQLTTLKLLTDFDYSEGVNVVLPYVDYLVIDGNKNVSKSMFNNGSFDFRNITNVFISDNVTGVNDYALSELTGVTNLEIPNFANSTLERMGVSKSLEVLNLKPTDNKMLNSGYILNYNNLSLINLPEGVETVGSTFISYCNSLNTLTLPSTIKEINSNLVTNCTNLNSLNLNDGLLVVGDNLISGCPNIYSVNLPESVTTVGKYLVANSGYLDYVYVPSTVTTIGLPLIGANVQVQNLNVPFIGATVDIPVKFSQFNLSYADTYSLNVQNGFNAVNNMFDGCTNLETFVCKGEIQGISKGFFNNCDSLQKLEISGTFNANLADLFGREDKQLAYLVISTDEVSETFFAGCSFEVLMVKSIDIVLNKQFTDMVYAGVLFLSYTQTCVLDASTLSGRVNLYASDVVFPSNIGNYVFGTVVTNANSFYDDYILYYSGQ